MGGACGSMRERRGIYKISVGRPEGKKQVGRRRLRWDDIKIDLKEVSSRGMDWIVEAQDRDSWRALENAVMKLRVT